MLELKKINKSYRTGSFVQHALKDISLKFRKSEFVAILGPSGSGKTTMLNIIGGLDRYDSGDLIINGKSTKKFKSRDWDSYRNNCIGFIFQNYNLISHISILENVEMGMTLSGISAKKRRKKALEVLEKVGLKEHAHKRPNQLSGGQMQRVAIARALANDPDVILADEPTGALDSKTSIQIMNLIKEIAKDKLVIMVTHNRELAEEYASRIVEFKDGELLTDSDMVSDDEELKERKIKKTAMSFLTALKLSFNNIKTKKGRTLITAFASSIGIVGIALILSLSNGFNIQIDKFETETLSNMPIMISKEGMVINEDTMVSMGSDNESKNEYQDVEVIYPRESILNKLLHKNDFTDEYLNYVSNIDKSLAVGISYMRATGLNILGKVDGKVEVIPTSVTSGQSYFNVIPFKLDKDSEGVTEKNYDLLKGKLPENKNELVLIIDSRNRLDKELVKYLGFDANRKEISFDEILNCEFRLILNNEFYKNLGNFYTLNQDFDAMYASDSSIPLKVVGIIRGKKDNKLTRSDSGIGYTEELVEHVILKNKESNIVKLQEKVDYNVLTGEKIPSTKEGLETKKMLLSYLGANGVPIVINIYPKDFDSKEKIVEYLDEFNNKEIDKVNEREDLLKNVDKNLSDAVPDAVELSLLNGKLSGTIKVGNSEFKVTDGEITKSTGGVIYNDLAATMVSLSGSLMDAVTIVLIAFSAISLVVSSIMIGIITYISVLERTKEIGILRALGARKKDISRVFNAETFIIGISSGLIGILIARLLIIPANVVLYKLTELENVARLNPYHALILIIVSVTLTVIGGLIPAHVASKKDPVEALRTE